MTFDTAGEAPAWPDGPFAIRLGEGCRFCPGDDASAENYTIGTIPAADGTYELLFHQWWCPVSNPDPPLDI